MIDEIEFRSLLEKFASDAGSKVYKTSLIDEFAAKMYPSKSTENEETVQEEDLMEVWVMEHGGYPVYLPNFKVLSEYIEPQMEQHFIDCKNHGFEYKDGALEVYKTKISKQKFSELDEFDGF